MKNYSEDTSRQYHIQVAKGEVGRPECAVALLLTCGDGEQRAEVYGCAADRQQASIVFDVAADMVRMCPALMKRVRILTAQKRIVYTPTNSFYQVLSAEAYSKHGFNIHGVVFDEFQREAERLSTLKADLDAKETDIIEADHREFISCGKTLIFHHDSAV